MQALLAEQPKRREWRLTAKLGRQMLVTYIVVLGLEAISAYLQGVIFLKEGSSLTRLIGVAFWSWLASWCYAGFSFAERLGLIFFQEV